MSALVGAVSTPRGTWSYPQSDRTRRRSSSSRKECARDGAHLLKFYVLCFCVRCEWPACTGPVCVLWA